MILSWKETRLGIVRVDERLPWGQSIAIGGFTLNGITLGTFGATQLYQIFQGVPDTDDFAIVGDEAEAEAEIRAGTADRPRR